MTVRQGTELLVTAMAVDVPWMPGTLRDIDVPHYFRERHVHTGYRPLHRDWRYYGLSLFRWHNETLNVWTHLLGVLLVLLRFAQLAETVDFAGDAHAWPLLILLLSSVSYMSFSVAAHLLGGRSELCHYAFFFLDYVGVALYQYGSAVAHFYYAPGEDWQGHLWLQGAFLPMAALLCCCSCFGCCYGKYRRHGWPHGACKLGQVVPCAVAYAWDSSPVFDRLWGCLPLCSGDAAAPFHAGQVACFLASAFFFTLPVPEHWLAGPRGVLSLGHELFHTLLVLCTLCQIEASHLDYLSRRALYLRFHGDGDAASFCILFVAVGMSCMLIAILMMLKVKRLLDNRSKLM